MRKLATLLSTLVICSCSGSYEQFDTSIQLTRAPGATAITLVTIVTPQEWVKGNPDVSAATFALEPGETETKTFSNTKLPGRRYAFTSSMSAHEVPLVTVVTSVYQGDSIVFRSKQEIVSHGL